MKMISINVGQPREVLSHGKRVQTSIFKTPVAGPVRVTRLNLDGDRQSDLTVHGGVDKAVYVYPTEHYTRWGQELPGFPQPWGAFGENFSTEGLLETSVQIGDRLQIGTALFQISQPRMPCFKLAIRFDRPDMLKRFLVSGRSGYYLRVLQEGIVSPDDAISISPVEGASMSVAEIFKLYTDDEAEPERLLQASQLPDLAEGWREHFRERLG